MKKRIYMIILLYIIFCIVCMHKCFAKYIMYDDLSLRVFIDKTPPIISVYSNENEDEYCGSNIEIVKKRENVKIKISDNVGIKYNEIYYNATENNFTEQIPTNFHNIKDLTDEGYYKVVAVDTAGNQTEIIILIDKTVPEITVKYYKKNEISKFNYTNIIKKGGVIL